jgi:hypothetical protein
MAVATVGSKTDVTPGFGAPSFYWYSGVKSVDNTETDMIATTDTGDRDFRIKFQVAVTNDISNDYRLTIYTGPADGTAADVVLYQSDMTETADIGRHGPVVPIELIVPKDSAFRVTLDNVVGTTARNWTLTAVGEYFLK